MQVANLWDPVDESWDERRTSERFPFEIVAWLRARDGRIEQAMTFDMSKGGARLVMPAGGFEPGHRITVSFEAEDIEQEKWWNALITWRRVDEMGVEFLGLTEADHMRLNHFLVRAQR